MRSVNLNIRDEAYEKIMYILNSLPKEDIEIEEEIDPTKLSKDDFDYMSKEELNEIDRVINEAKEKGFDNLKSFEELKNEL